ncbi:hypothetical protein FPQ18DRAFT_397982, partial [Pyronema domesticum]
MSSETPVSIPQLASATSKRSTSHVALTIKTTNLQPPISHNRSISNTLSIDSHDKTISGASTLVPNSPLFFTAEHKAFYNVEDISARISVLSLRDTVADIPPTPIGIAYNIALTPTESTTDIARLSATPPTVAEPASTTSEDTDLPDSSLHWSDAILPPPPHTSLINHAICPLSHIVEGTTILNNAHYTRIIRLHYQTVNQSLAQFLELRCGCLIGRWYISNIWGGVGIRIMGRVRRGL